MIIYTPEQVAAAKAVANADADMLSYLHDEPTGEQAWEEWNDRYQAAYQAYEDAAANYRRLLGDIDPHDVIQGAPINPLVQVMGRTCKTADGYFLAGPFFHDSDYEPWSVDLYDPPLSMPGVARRVVTVEVSCRAHAQQMVDLVTWALGAGACTSEAVKTVPSESGDQYMLNELPA
jgi:hypothetical protein